MARHLFDVRGLKAKCNWCEKIVPAELAVENNEGEYFCSEECREEDDADTASLREGN